MTGMTITDVLAINRAIAIRDRELLLAHVLGAPRERIFAHPETTVHPARVMRYRRLLRAHARGVPLPHLLGEQWFAGRPFCVTRDVLIPRPETELLVELACTYEQRAGDAERGSPTMCICTNTLGVRSGRTRERPGIIVVDVGTGSGCIAVTLASELPGTRIIAIDASPAALRVARGNARRHHVASRIAFRHGNLLEPLLRSRSFVFRHSSFVITANLPYLTTAEWRALPKSIRAFEPRMAFDGGLDGLAPFRTLFNQLRSFDIRHATFVILEIDPRRKRALAALVRKMLPSWEHSWHRDLAGRWRVLELTAQGYSRARTPPT